jgi:hypothetical protein
VIKRAENIQLKQQATQDRGTRGKNVESLKQIRQRLRNVQPFCPHEYANLFGLHLARMLCPHKRRLSWAVPAATFNAWMSRNWYEYLYVVASS